MPSLNHAAPAFRLTSTSGTAVSLADLRGQRVLLFFYPRDNTPGCTQEACDFRDNIGRLTAAGALVFGVSGDSIASHERFREKYKLPYHLLSDPGNEVAAKYGAYGEKTLYGRKVVGIIRSTFLIDEEGVLRAIWSPVKIKGHVAEILREISSSAESGEDAVRSAAARAKRRAPAKKTSKKASKKTSKKKRKKTAKKATRRTVKKAAKKTTKKKKAATKKASRKTARTATQKPAAKKKAVKKRPAKSRASTTKKAKKKAAKKSSTRKQTATRKKAKRRR